jgi:hypothetical protein
MRFTMLGADSTGKRWTIGCRLNVRSTRKSIVSMDVSVAPRAPVVARLRWLLSTEQRDVSREPAAANWLRVESPPTRR